MKSEEQILKGIGARIKEVREAKVTASGKSWSQAHLAAAIDTSTSQISKIETGQREPGILMIYKISKALGVTPADLLV